MCVADAIAAAESILPGQTAPAGGKDPRWQAIIEVGRYVESNPQEVWRFAAKWGKFDDPDLQSAIATCLLEHLLEYHFKLLFPQVRAMATADRNFAHTFLGCWKFGQAELPENSKAFDALRVECDQISG